MIRAYEPLTAVIVLALYDVWHIFIMAIPNDSKFIRKLTRYSFALWNKCKLFCSPIFFLVNLSQIPVKKLVSASLLQISDALFILIYGYEDSYCYHDTSAFHFGNYSVLLFILIRSIFDGINCKVHVIFICE